MWQNIENFELPIIDRRKNFTRMVQLEEEIKKQGDKITTLVTTEKTNPMNEKVAPPMSMDDIKAN